MLDEFAEPKVLAPDVFAADIDVFAPELHGPGAAAERLPGFDDFGPIACLVERVSGGHTRHSAAHDCHPPRANRCHRGFLELLPAARTLGGASLE